MHKIINEVCKDYTCKLKNKDLQSLNVDEINNLISFLNFSFKTKNDFFIEKFNKKMIKQVTLVYNQLKTNILVPEIIDIFNDIDESDIKLIRYIVINYVNNFEIIQNNEPELCSKISKDSMKNLIFQLSEKLK